MTEFVTGQRWISSTEPDLGLGIIVECAHRRVTISFPAAGEERVYAADTAPLSRVRYEIGDTVADLEDAQYRVCDVSELSGYLIYHVEDDLGNMVDMPEIDLTCFAQFHGPKERVLTGQIDRHSRFQLRRDTLEHAGRLRTLPVRGLLGARVQLLPHQLYIAEEIANRHAPRVLLADEVGLGKTIEAGLILHQQVITGRASRILIVVPDSLVHQWLVEMLRRFNLHFTILDELRCASVVGDDDEEDVETAPNPFESAQFILCGLSLMLDEERLAQALECDWDLLVVDEAHHLAWSPELESPAYRHVAALASRAEGLLLLTATPEQLGVDSHFARLRLLDPARFHSLEAFRAEESGYQAVNELVESVVASTDGLNAELQSVLAERVGEARVAAFTAALAAADDAAEREQLASALARELMDHYGTGRVLFRNTRATIEGFPERVLHSHPLEAPADFSADELNKALQPERALGDGWTKLDPRVAWLAEWLNENKTQKALVICAQAETAKALDLHLRLGEGLRSAVFHEGNSLLERDRAAAWFADADDGAQVLVCSEIGSEGRNFQFAQHLVLFDLPLNPDLLEQRIGRLDRIGQPGRVQIHVPYFEHGAQHRLLRWYNEGIDAFSRPFPAGQALFVEFGDELAALLSTDDGAFDDFIERSRAFADNALEQLNLGRNRLLERHSCDPAHAAVLIDQIETAEQPNELLGWIERIFEEYGVETEPHSARSLIARPGDHMLDSEFPGMPSDGISMTIDRDNALSREDLAYLSWEHPLATGAMDWVMNSEFGNTTLCRIKVRGLPPGTVLAETLFSLHCAAPKALQANRYLSAKPLRLLFDNTGRDLSDAITGEQLDRLRKDVSHSMAQDVVRHTRPQLESLLAACEKQAAKEQSRLIAESIESMQAEREAELQRLIALARVNPNIRDEEIEWHREAIDALTACLQRAQLRMDAVRIAVVTE